VTAKILVIDDSPTVSNTVGWILNDFGYEVRMAPDGLSALSTIHIFKPDLLLLDVKLPHVDGIKLCEMLRNHAAYVSLPIVMLSGLSSQKDIDRALAAGANSYVVKPVNDEKLLAIIRQELENGADRQSVIG
jgi:DNA-binding response OmpR family regulator